LQKYEIIPTTKSASTKEVRMAWLDVTGACGVSEFAARKGYFEKKMLPGWTSTINGQMLYGTGHVHDGGEVRETHHVERYRKVSKDDDGYRCALFGCCVNAATGNKDLSQTRRVDNRDLHFPCSLR
jgi:hypothetical protein